MTDTVRLLSVKGRGQLIRKFYFYDGETDITDGVVEIPLDKPEWIQRAYIMGYRHDPVSEAPLTLAEALAGEKVQPDTSVESTESAGEDVENPDGGGLAPDTDGVRESEPESVESVPEPEVGSGDGGLATEVGAGDNAPA